VTGILPTESPAAGTSTSPRLGELAALFFKLGVISFGGPASHIAMIEAEIVRKRGWVSNQQFLDMLGASNLIPGPTSTELAITTGFVRAGWPGLWVAGACFISPAALITGVFAWAYVRFGSLPQTASVLVGIKPAVIAVIAIAVWRLARTAAKNVELALLGILGLFAFFLGANPLLVLFGGGLVGMLARRFPRSHGVDSTLLLVRREGFLLSSFRISALAAATSIGAIAVRPSIARIGIFFLKLGAVLYGGGYVLLAFLQHGLVQQNGWLTQRQLLDAVAIGQFTPGPVFSTATFIGYLLGGVPGAAVATVGIFLPSFFYVALLAPVLFRLRQSPWISAFLDAVNICAVSLMIGVTFRLGMDAMRGWGAWVIGAVSLGVLLRWKVSPAWIVLGGGIAGLVLAAIP